MQFYSTNHISQNAGLRDAVLTGLAPDGGLYLPERIPTIPRAFFRNIPEMSLREIAFVVADLMLGEEIDSATIKRIVYDTFTFDVPLTELSPEIYALELFHGPTLAFKDVGARFLARVIAHFTGGRPGNEPMKVVVATSGDSGGAVASGFFGVPGVEVYVLYPKGRLSEVQRRQFLELEGNIHPIEVSGTFDQCQRLTRELLTDKEAREKAHITTANSLNICRLLPQTFYFFYAYARMMAHNAEGGDPVIAIPCGNLGNLTAGLMAMEMGLPVKRLVAATNANDAVLKFLATGEFKPFTPVATAAKAMDVATPANMARIAELCHGDFAKLSERVEGVAASDLDIVTTIRDLYERYHYLCDPHGATACHGLMKALRPGERGIFLSTAHPSKFPDTIFEATGLRLPTHRSNAKQRHLQPPTRIAPTLSALTRVMLDKT